MKQSVLGLGFLAASMSAWAITAPPSAPTFYCDTDRPASADTVEAQLNTTRLTPASPTLENQGRWEYGRPFSTGVSVGDANIPSSLSWNYFTLNDLNVGGGVTTATVNAAVGFQPQAGATAPTVRYFRYRFNLAATVDPATYLLSLSGMSADDRIVGTYLNGVQISTGAAATAGGGATSALQWRSGANELAFAILDTNPAATHFTLTSAAQTTCNFRAIPASVPVVHPVGLALMGVLVAGAGALRTRRRANLRG
jgi:hypothetical protein